EPGALPRAASLSRRGGRTSVSSTSSRNLSFTLPTPKADTTLKWRSSTASTDSTPGATDATNSWSRSRCHTCSGGAAISGAPENSSRIPPTCFDIPGTVSLPAMPSHAGASAKLSKSRFLSGLQCHKQLWWRVHEPEAAELTPTKALQNLFAQGAQVGERARRYVPGGELIDLPFYQLDNKVAATRESLRRDPPALYEAAFLADDTYAAVDILERGPGGARGYGVIEVKASNSLKPEHIPDVAVQVHVLRQGGLSVERAEVMHLNPDCRHPDLSKLFVREDVTAAVEGALLGVPDQIAAQLRMLGGPLPDVPIGEHCTKPYDCPFLDRCWKLPQHHVSTLYRIERRKVLEYEADGYATIYDLPTDLELSAIHARQVQAVTSGRLVAQPALAAALTGFAGPLAFLDFETVAHAIGAKLIDLLPVIRNHVYHPDFGGSFSIKHVLPALVPSLAYGDLEINEGETASVELQRLMFDRDAMRPQERARLRQALLSYC